MSESKDVREEKEGKKAKKSKKNKEVHEQEEGKNVERSRDALWLMSLSSFVKIAIVSTDWY